MVFHMIKCSLCDQGIYMKTKNAIILPLFTTALVVILSLLSTNLWMEKKEEVTASHSIKISTEMTLQEISTTNGIPFKVIVQALNKPDLDPLKSLTVQGFSFLYAREEILKNFAVYQENETKNWFKIPLKFILWFIFMSIVFYQLIKQGLSPKKRKIYYAISVLVFGVILGSDPSPMGTVKDAIALYGEKGVIFPPRMIALCIFLLTVFLANKMICAWGCQFGSLQDLLFRFNRNSKDTMGVIKQYKIPFIVSNSIRLIFFVAFIAISFIWSIDIIAEIDPFKIFRPQFLTAAGIVFLILLFLASIVVYRPWCYLFCPFGLIGWIVEKMSRYKIKVNYEKCIACLACEKACPSDVMSAILRQDRVIPDCFSCGVCTEICPEKAISFSKEKREKPSVAKFNKQ